MKRAYAIRRSRAAGWAKLCGALAVPVLVLAAIGVRTGFIPESALVPSLALGFLLGLVALFVAIYALIDVWNSGAEGANTAVAGVIYALPALVLLGVIGGAVIIYPRLTDVTTSAVDPPEFTLGRAPQEPPATEAIVRQLAAYPDIATRLYPLPLGKVYPAVRAIVEDDGWSIVRDSKPAVMPESAPGPESEQVPVAEEIIRELALKSVVTQSRGEAGAVAADAAGSDLGDAAGQIATLEATAKTLVFGFRDDVVIRMRATPEGTEVDMRSASEVGQHDLGQNARRIRAFFKALDGALLPEPGAGGTGVASAGG